MKEHVFSPFFEKDESKVHVLFEAPDHTSIINLFLDILGNILGKPWILGSTLGTKSTWQGGLKGECSTQKWSKSGDSEYCYRFSIVPYFSTKCIHTYYQLLVYMISVCTEYCVYTIFCTYIYIYIYTYRYLSFIHRCMHLIWEQMLRRDFISSGIRYWIQTLSSQAMLNWFSLNKSNVSCFVHSQNDQKLFQGIQKSNTLELGTLKQRNEAHLFATLMEA